MLFLKAPEIQREIVKIVRDLKLVHISSGQITCFRSHGSSSRAIARIWSFPRIWQLALNLPPNYAIEVISERFDKLDPQEQVKVLIHELLHIPKTFSGALVPHHNRGKTIDHRRVEQIYLQLLASRRK